MKMGRWTTDSFPRPPSIAVTKQMTTECERHLCCYNIWTGVDIEAISVPEDMTRKCFSQN
jgi:hypothetical protein